MISHFLSQDYFIVACCIYLPVCIVPLFSMQCSLGGLPFTPQPTMGTKMPPDQQSKLISVTKIPPDQKSKLITVIKMSPDQQSKLISVTKIPPDQKSKVQLKCMLAPNDKNYINM